MEDRLQTQFISTLPGKGNITITLSSCLKFNPHATSPFYMEIKGAMDANQPFSNIDECIEHYLTFKASLYNDGYFSLPSIDERCSGSVFSSIENRVPDTEPGFVDYMFFNDFDFEKEKKTLFQNNIIQPIYHGKRVNISVNKTDDILVAITSEEGFIPVPSSLESHMSIFLHNSSTNSAIFDAVQLDDKTYVILDIIWLDECHLNTNCERRIEILQSLSVYLHSKLAGIVVAPVLSDHTHLSAKNLPLGYSIKCKKASYLDNNYCRHIFGTVTEKRVFTQSDSSISLVNKHDLAGHINLPINTAPYNMLFSNLKTVFLANHHDQSYVWPLN